MTKNSRYPSVGRGHWLLGSVNWLLLSSLLIGSLPGIYVGSHFAARLPDRVLRPLLAGTLLLVGIRMCDRENREVGLDPMSADSTFWERPDSEPGATSAMPPPAAMEFRTARPDAGCRLPQYRTHLAGRQSH